ncbi:hypothetical protein TIFTF001_028033 [Ficus carica]|uniref:Uncharacterized protein n=1 Tax=Ficus carica TaxID=3494 RepID=A0AA88J134_FICCA|nr:hypothetical protein TIFTF001_028033 [Ficus carica]
MATNQTPLNYGQSPKIPERKRDYEDIYFENQPMQINFRFTSDSSIALQLIKDDNTAAKAAKEDPL